MNVQKAIVLNNDTVIIKNQNTTIGYARFNIEHNILEYLFVNPMFRRRGVGSKLMNVAEKGGRACSHSC